MVDPKRVVTWVVMAAGPTAAAATDHATVSTEAVISGILFLACVVLCATGLIVFVINRSTGGGPPVKRFQLPFVVLEFFDPRSGGPNDPEPLPDPDPDLPSDEDAPEEVTPSVDDLEEAG